MNIEILDTTLRDGEQTCGVSFASSEKLHIARILLVDLKVDRIEVASAKVSDGEYETVKKIARWAVSNGYIDRIEVLGFVDGEISLNWIKSAGCKVMNLLCKGSLKHCIEQLKKTPEQHLTDIKKVLNNAEKMDVIVNIYLEDWSNGMLSSQDYVFFLIDNLKNTNIRKFMLSDTLGILNPVNTNVFCKKIHEKYPDICLDFHAHNDYDLAVGNVLSAINAGITGIHTTVNGLGERAGNAPLASVVAIVHDQLKIKTNISEKYLNQVSRIVESYSGIRVPQNKPIIGDNVFTQCAGIHVDGDSKNNLYCNDLLPERFGRSREYALGKTSGISNIRKNLEVAGIELDEWSMKKLTERIVELGDKKEIVTQDDLPYIISDILHSSNTDKIRIINYSLSLTYDLLTIAAVKIEINEREYEQTSFGDGQYHAFYQAIRKIYAKLNKSLPILKDYNVSIPPGGRTDALVQTIIVWNFKGKDFKICAIDVDQTKAAIKATIRMLNKIECMMI
ncbi:MAG: 2-isopropylmalate synthase [Bacteroidales bacterium OttesenSCG-928-I14]|nr:2-isopropylmalate synthase [Bacteroidales bacterium OttesenSCG-928-I14]